MREVRRQSDEIIVPDEVSNLYFNGKVVAMKDTSNGQCYVLIEVEETMKSQWTFVSIDGKELWVGRYDSIYMLVSSALEYVDTKIFVFDDEEEYVNWLYQQKGGDTRE